MDAAGELTGKVSQRVHKGTTRTHITLVYKKSPKQRCEGYLRSPNIPLPGPQS